MKAKILTRVLMPAVLAALLVFPAFLNFPEAQTLVSGTYIYTLGTDGTADVSIIINNVSGQTVIYVKVDPGIIAPSLVVINEKGDIVPANIVGQTIAQIVVANQSTQLFVKYEAIVGEVSDGLVKDIITPGGPATIRLPAGGALLYFNGTPSTIEMIGNQIVIEYSNPGVYEIEFTLPPPNTTTPYQTTTTTSTTTTTQTQTTTSTNTTTTTPPTSTTETSTSTTTTNNHFYGINYLKPDINHCNRHANN